MEMNISQPKINNEINSERIANANFRVLVNIQKLIEHLEETKLESTSKEIADLFDQQQPLSYLSLIALQSYSCFISQKKDAKLYLNLFKQIDTLLKDKTEYKIIKFFSEYLYDLESNESNYLLNQMIEEHLIEPEFVMKKDTFYFAHYKPKDCLTSYQNILNFEELIKDDYKLHKEKIKEGYNPTEIAKIIRLDNVEELQKISSETNFNFNQSIIPSPYERYSFVTKRRVMTRFGFVGEDVKLCDYAAFYGSLECFKFLLLNGANVSNSGKYAVAGGSTEILYLCEQNNATFKSAFNAAIEFHQKKIFDYLYNKKPEEFQKIINDLGDSCVVNNNFIILDFLLDKGLNKETILKSSIENGNFYLVQYILEGKQIPQELFPITANPINHEILKQSLDKGGININYVLEICFICLKFFMIF